MSLIADLHIHSKYSRGCSKNLDLDTIEKYGRIKGLDLVGTGDFTHPAWIKTLKKNLVEREGIQYTQTGFKFVLQTEISFIYTFKGKGRRIHLILLAPDFCVVDQITEYFLKHGRIDYDGRPIFKIPCPEFVEAMKKISSKIEIIPAHIWTPHFSLFGEYNQFSTVEECFEDQTKHIYALETGLSSNPLMNWSVPNLDRYQLVSFSDSHGYWPWRLGREATVFEIPLNYDALIKAIRTGSGLTETLEVDPNFGKYHLTGHRSCNVCVMPHESRKLQKICPVCHKKLTIGVLERVETLATRKEEEAKKLAKDRKPYKTLVPLSELLAAQLHSGVGSQKVWKIYSQLVNPALGRTEFDLLLRTPEQELKTLVEPAIVALILKNRAGRINVKPGYDGVYGIPLVT